MRRIIVAGTRNRTMLLVLCIHFTILKLQQEIERF